MTNQERLFLSSLSQQSATTDINGQIAFLQALIDEGERFYDAQLLEAARTDITAFSEYIEPEWVPARHHQLMLQKLVDNILHGEDQRLIVSMPVGHAKTVYSSFITPAYQFGLDPHTRVIAAGHTQNFVETAISRKVRGIIQSERYKKVFPDTQISPDSRASDYFTFVSPTGRQPGHYVARGAGSGIAGFRATRIFADDLYPNMEAANSKAFREKVKEWWFGDLMTRLLPGGNAVLVCTRWHADDVIGNLLEAMQSGGEKWDTVLLPAVCEDPENDPLGRAEGEALWPELHTIDHLLKIKRNSPTRTWNCLYQGNPVAEGGGVVKEEWFSYWDHKPADHLIRRRFVAFDCANSATARSDFTVGTAWIETVDKRFFLVDAVRKRVEFPDLVKLVDEFARRNEASSILVEDAGHGKALIQSQQGTMFAPIIGLKPGNKSKDFRFDSVSPLFETGAVLLPKHHELKGEIEKELLEFPNSAKDDIVDSISHALNWARGSNVHRGMRKLKGAA